jgi:hypothetical protein
MMINIASGIVMVAVVDSDGNRVFDETSQAGYTFRGENDTTKFTTEMEKTINPSGNLDDKSDQVYRVLDLMSLGFIYKFFNVIDDYMYGFVNMLESVIGPMLNSDTRLIMFGNQNNDDLIPNSFGALKVIISIGYIMFGISLFTGKDIFEGN